jgi:hypothetical protein
MFESARWKVERAKHHIAELDSEINDFLAKNEGQIFSHGDPKGGQGSIGIEPLGAPSIFNIMVGDIVHNLRSALDHIAGEITSLSTNGCRKAVMDSKFPMSHKPENFPTAVAKFIEPYDPEVAAALCAEMTSSEIWYKSINSINRLNNTDKHRTVVVVLTSVGVAAEGVRIGGIYFAGIKAVDCGVMIGNFGGQPLEFERNPYPTISVVFGDGEGFEGEPVIDQLTEAPEIVLHTINLCEKHSRFGGE